MTNITKYLLFAYLDHIAASGSICEVWDVCNTSEVICSVFVFKHTHKSDIYLIHIQLNRICDILINYVQALH